MIEVLTCEGPLFEAILHILLLINGNGKLSRLASHGQPIFSLQSLTHFKNNFIYFPLLKFSIAKDCKMVTLSGTIFQRFASKNVEISTQNRLSLKIRSKGRLTAGSTSAPKVPKMMLVLTGKITKIVNMGFHFVKKLKVNLKGT